MLSFIHPQLTIDDYKFIREIGKGQFSVVWEALHLVTNHQVAIKCLYDSDSYLPDSILEEIRINSQFFHPFICQYIDSFIYNSTYFIVFEECVENLVTFSNKRGYLNEKTAHKIFVELVYAIEFLHSNHFIHRDLRVENILLDSNKNIRISDFGLSISTKEENVLLNQVGSIYYMSPEMLQNEDYGQSVDIWSLGVILYSITNGRLPFDGNNIDEIKENICHSQPFFESHVSSFQLKSFIMRMLDKNQRSRITINEIKSHAWFNLYKYHPFETYLKHQFDLSKMPINVQLIDSFFDSDLDLLRKKIEQELKIHSSEINARSKEFISYLIKMRENLTRSIRIEEKDIIKQIDSLRIASTSKGSTFSQSLRASVKKPIIPVKKGQNLTSRKANLSKTTRITKK